MRVRTRITFTVGAATLGLMAGMLPAQAITDGSSDGSLERLVPQTSVKASDAASCDSVGIGKRRDDCVKVKIRKKDRKTASRGRLRIETRMASPGDHKVRVQRWKGTHPHAVIGQDNGRWKTLKKARTNGSKKVKVKVRNRYGNNQYRAVVKNYVPRSKARISTRMLRMGSTATSAVTASTAGVAGWSYKLSNNTGKDLRLVAKGRSNDRNNPEVSTSFPNGSTRYIHLVRPVGDTAAGFTLRDGNTDYIYTLPSGYSDCKDPIRNGLSSMKSGDEVNVKFRDNPVGYSGDLRFPDGNFCNFQMLTAFERELAINPVEFGLLAGGVMILTELVVAGLVAAIPAAGAAGAASEAPIMGLSEEAMIQAEWEELFSSNSAGLMNYLEEEVSTAAQWQQLFS